MRLANKVNPQQVLLNKAPEILQRNRSISKTLGLVVFKLVMHSLLDTAHSHSQNTPSPGNARKTGTNTCRPRGGLANHVIVVLASPSLRQPGPGGVPEWPVHPQHFPVRWGRGLQGWQ